MALGRIITTVRKAVALAGPPATRLVVMATVVAMACQPPAARADLTGNDLWNVCHSNADKDYGLCFGYVIALAEVTRHQLLINQGGLYGWSACLSEYSTGQQFGDVVKRWLDQHPEMRHFNAVSLVAQALAEAFPCKP